MLPDTVQYYRATSSAYQGGKLTRLQFDKYYYLKNRWVYRLHQWRFDTAILFQRRKLLVVTGEKTNEK